MEKQIKEKAFLYCRVSTQEQTLGYSLNAQLDKLKEYCKDKFEIAGEIKTHESAKEEGRVHFNEMLARVEKEKIPNIVVWSTDRLSRNDDDIARIKKLVEKGVQVHLVSEGQILNANDYNGEMLFTIKAAVSKRDNKDKGAKVHAGLERKFKEGKWIGFARIGYLNFVKEGGQKTIILDPDRAPKVKKIFELYDTGRYSLRALQREAEKMGLRVIEKPPKPFKKPWDEMDEGERADWKEAEERRRKSKPMSVSGIAKMLSSNFYVGQMKMKGNPNNGNHPAIISRELYDSVQIKLKEARRNMVAERRPNGTFPWRQYSRCGYCGGKITAGRTVKELKNGEVKEFVYYHCAKQKNPNCPGRPYTDTEIEELISSGIENIHFEVEVFESLCQDIMKTNIKQEKANEKELKRLKRDWTEENAKVEILLDQLVERKFPKELLDEKLKKINENVAEIEAAMAEVEGKLNDKWREQSIAAARAFMKFKDRFVELDTKGKVKMLEHVLERVILKDDKVSYVWRQPWASIFSYSEEYVEEIERLADDVVPEDEVISILPKEARV